MLDGFHKYLVDNGWKRTKYDYKLGHVEDNENMFVSSYGPISYDYHKDGKTISWGLYEKDLPPRWSFDPKRQFTGLSNEGMITKIDKPQFTVIINGVEL